MPNTFQTKVFILSILVYAIFCISCGQKTDEDQIRELMREAGQHIGFEELFPKSLSILKKLFPDK
jgi:hypothetical protein